MSLIITYPIRQAVLALITGGGGPLDSADLVVGLLTELPAGGTRITLADCEAVEPDGDSFPGYARIDPTVWGDPYRDGADNCFQDMGEMEWICSDDPPADLTVVAAFWSNGTDVIVDTFPAPQTVTKKDDPVRYIGQFGYGQ